METRTFKLHKDYWDCGNLYARAEHTFNKGITVLVDVTALERVPHLPRSKNSLDLSKNPTLHSTMCLVVEAVCIKVCLMGGILVESMLCALLFVLLKVRRSIKIS